MSNLKVAIAGASGGIGQPLALLMKHVTNISQLVLYDIKNCVGVATDLSHIETTVSIKGYNGAKTVVDALKGSDIILMVAGVPRKPNMTRDDLFNMNASTVRDLTRAMAKAAPKALLAIVTNPINTVVPIACEVLRKAGAFDRSRVFGVTTLDLVRASTFVGQDKKMDPKKVHIPCIGGHSGPTIIPVFSQAKPQLSYPKEKVVAFTKRIKTAGTEVVKAKGAGSATLSTAYATARFANALIRGMTGEKNVIECAYVRSDVAECKYFSNPLLIGKHGIEKNLGYGKLNDMEKEMVKSAIPILKTNIKKGEDYAAK